MKRFPISAIVCVDREIRFLAQSLASIAGQTVKIDEIVLVYSERSPRALFDVIDGFPITITTKQKAPGLAAARNEGMAQASGEVITFLDADDTWDPEKTAVQATRLDEPVDAVIGRLKRFRDPSVSPGAYPEGFFEHSHPAVTPGGMMIKRRAIQRAGLFDTGYRLACDHEWMARVRESGVNVALTDDVVLYKRVHAGALSLDRAAYRREIFDMLRDPAET